MNHWIDQSIRLPREGSPKILCLHGFVGSPFDLKPLVDTLTEQYDVFIPKLEIPTGDGENTYAQAKECYKEYAPDAIIGFSMGGAITMQLPSCTKVIIAPYQGLPYGNRLITKAATSLSFLNVTIPKFQSGRIKSQEGKKKYKPGQWSFTTESFLALQRLISKPRYPEIRDSLFWIHSPQDPVACYKKAHTKWSTVAKHLCVDNAEHVLLYEDDAQNIVHEICAYVHGHLL